MERGTIMTQPTTQLNRAQRRAANRKPRTNRNDLPLHARQAWARKLEACRPYEPGEMVPEFVQIRAGFERLRTGAGTTDDFDLVSMTLNMGVVRAEAIDASLVKVMADAQDAFVRMKDRYLHKGLALGFDAQGLQDVPYALNVYEAIVNNSSPQQMLLSIRETYARIRAGNVLGVHA